MVLLGFSCLRLYDSFSRVSVLSSGSGNFQPLSHEIYLIHFSLFFFWDSNNANADMLNIVLEIP